jgi:hypothetical protein
LKLKTTVLNTKFSLSHPRPNITGDFKESVGVLSFSGSASAAEYMEIIKSIQYNYVDTKELILDSQQVCSSR